MSFTVKPANKIFAEKLDSYFGVKDYFVEYNPGRCVLPRCYENIAQQVLDAKVRDDDVWLISFPRTGSTWCQEMIWLIGNDLDFETAQKTLQQIRAPLIELSTSLHDYYDTCLNDIIGNSVEFVENQPSPRYIKCHLPNELLPVELDKVKPKTIYIARNPKDVCVSYYHHLSLIHNLSATFEDFCELFLNDYSPYGPLIDHYLGFWNKRHESNILFLKYEDIKRDLRGTLHRIADFLGKSLNEEQYDELCEYLSLANMRNNSGCNMAPIIESKLGKDYYNKMGKSFFRKGQVGDHKNYMTPELSQRFDDWVEKNTVGTGLSFE